MRWTKAEKGFAAVSRVARLATVDAPGIPHNVPICPLLADGKIYLGTEAGVKKVRNLQGNPTCLRCDYRNLNFYLALQRESTSTGDESGWVRG